jgi:hypothetical protein
MVAALALATTNQAAFAQQGCTGGGSPSPSGSASESPSESELPIPISLPPVPVPDQKRDAPAPAPLPAPDANDRARVAQAADQQERTCRSTVTLAYNSGKTPKWTGKVGSDEPMCKRARDVTVKKIKRGADPTVAKATTNAKGNYTAPARNANGRFYAKVSKATTENDDGETVTCQGARSRAIRP